MLDWSEQVTLTVPVKLFRAVAEIVVVPDWPGEGIVKLVGVAVKLKLGVPVEVVMEAAAEVVEPW
jgi:hypothetical protein